MINLCHNCEEPIERKTDCIYPHAPQLHHECLFRLVVGSVAHIEGRCSCVDPNATETDPPNVSKREAARMALAAWQRLHPEACA
jgi:hypothetical protein